MKGSGRVVGYHNQKLMQGAESRRRILEAATVLMAESGYSATSVSAVSRRSGLPASSIYWHFGSKAGLVAAVIEEGAHDWFDRLPELDDLPGTPEEQVSTMFEVAARELETHPDFLRLMILVALEHSEVDEAAAEVLNAVRIQATTLLGEVFSRILHEHDAADASALAEEFADYAVIVSTGAFVQRFLHADGMEIREVFIILLRSLMALAYGRQNTATVETRKAAAG